MIQKPFGYLGNIPCLSCEEWLRPQNNYEPKDTKVSDFMDKVLNGSKPINLEVPNCNLKFEKCSCKNPKETSAYDFTCVNCGKWIGDFGLTGGKPIAEKECEYSVEKRLEALENLHEDLKDWLHKSKPHNQADTDNCKGFIQACKEIHTCECISSPEDFIKAEVPLFFCPNCGKKRPDSKIKPTPKKEIEPLPYTADTLSVKSKINELIQAVNEGRR
jgi:hypothetical protein